MIDLGIILLIAAAMAALCLSTRRLCRESGPLHRAKYRLGGWLLLLFAFGIAVTYNPWGRGVVLLLGAISPVTFTLVWLSVYRPRGLILLLPGCLVAGLAVIGSAMVLDRSPLP